MSFHVDDRPLEGEFLMRRDAARLARQDAEPGTACSLTLYRWARPTLSLGYEQALEPDFDPAALAQLGIPVVRRPTGGRAILHADEWTWSVVGDLADPLLGGSLRRSFGAVSALVRMALADLGVAVDAPGDGPGQRDASPLRAACFAAAWGHEIRWRGRKLAGGAQRRTRRSFLQQGTLLAGPGHLRLVDAMRLTPAERDAQQRALAASTVTLAEILGPGPDFRAFSRHLEAAWRRAREGHAVTALA